MSTLDASLATAVTGYEITLVEDPDLDVSFRRDRARGQFVVVVFRDGEDGAVLVAQCWAPKLPEALILAEQAVHNVLHGAAREAVTA